jgi:hypothetical protein
MIRYLVHQTGSPSVSNGKSTSFEILQLNLCILPKFIKKADVLVIACKSSTGKVDAPDSRILQAVF